MQHASMPGTVVALSVSVVCVWCLLHALCVYVHAYVCACVLMCVLCVYVYAFVLRAALSVLAVASGSHSRSVGCDVC